jgi:hypothetical protein
MKKIFTNFLPQRKTFMVFLCPKILRGFFWFKIHEKEELLK